MSPSKPFFEQGMRALGARLASHIRFDPATGCWVWTAAGQERGGRTWDDEKKKVVDADRLIYQRLYFKIPKGSDLHATCGNAACVNPDHRAPISRSETLRRAGVGENIAQLMRDKTACPQGHPYDEANTSRWDGSRHCKTCARERMRVRAAAKRASSAV
jgi:hypothetical protein